MMARRQSTRNRPSAPRRPTRTPAAVDALPDDAGPDQDEAISEELVSQLLRDMDDPSQWGEVEEIGPGFYRAPEVARQLAQAIAAYRAAHGLTQEQFGRLLLLHQSQIARLEAGQHTPTLETLVRLARHLGLTLTVTATPDGATLAVAGNTSSS